VESNFEALDQSLNPLSTTASQRESSYAGDSCGQSEVPTAKFYDAVQTANSDDLQQPNCNSSEEDATTELNETYVSTDNLCALTSDEKSHEVDMQV